MSATNKTTNIELPLFIGTDVPSWLGDWNEAMTTIDSQIATAKSDAQGAAATAGAASESAAQTAQGLVSVNNQISALQTSVNGIQTVNRQIATAYTNNTNSCECSLYYTSNMEIITVLIAYDRKANITDFLTVGNTKLFALASFTGTPFNIGTGNLLVAGFLPDLNQSGGNLSLNFNARIALCENSGNTYVGIVSDQTSITPHGTGGAKFPILRSGTYF